MTSPTRAFTVVYIFEPTRRQVRTWAAPSAPQSTRTTCVACTMTNDCAKLQNGSSFGGSRFATMRCGTHVTSQLEFHPESLHLRLSKVCKQLTLVLFRTRRRDECSRLKEGLRRRVRKSRQKEAAGAADAGLMQIGWSGRGV